jgi:hypothetical protein
MGFKRKRSADDSPLSVSSYAAASTPEAQSPTPFPQGFDGAMDMDVDTTSRHNGWDFASVSRVKSSDWGNRTRKRFRDNRPDERAIHGRHLSVHVYTLLDILTLPREHSAETLRGATQPPKCLACTL